MTNSFIKEAYTNLCKDKDTIFYSIKNSNSQDVNSTDTNQPSKNDCKHLCDNDSSCEIFTYNELILNGNNCKIYKTSDLSNNFSAKVDCQKAYNYDETGSYNGFKNDAIKVTSSSGDRLTAGSILGVGYVKPTFFRENQDKFRMTRYYLDLVKDIKNTFEELKTSTEVVRTSSSLNTYYKNVCPAGKIPHVYNIFDASNHVLTTGQRSQNGWYQIDRREISDSQYSYSFKESIPFGEINNARNEELCKQECDNKINCKMYIYNSKDNNNNCKLYTDEQMRKNLLDKMIVSCENDNSIGSTRGLPIDRDQNWKNTILNTNSFNYMTPLTSYGSGTTYQASQVHSDYYQNTITDGILAGTIQQDLSNNRGDYNGIVKFNSTYFNDYWNGTSLSNSTDDNGTVDLKFYDIYGNILPNTGSIVTRSMGGSGINNFFSDRTKERFRILKNRIDKLSQYLDVSNDIVFSRLIPDRTIVIRNDQGEILRDGLGNEITLQLTDAFLTSIAFDGMTLADLSNAIPKYKYYGVNDNEDVSGNMYNSVHDYVTNRLLKEDKQKNQLLGDLENIENNLTRSNILYLFLLFLFISIIIVFVLYKFKFKFMNDIRIIIFLLGIVIIVVLLHFLIK